MSYPPERSPSPPTLTRIHSPILNIPTPSLLRSVAEAAHYSSTRHGPGEGRRASFGSSTAQCSLSPERARIVEDIKELFSLRPSLEIFERAWHPDATFEDPLSKCSGFYEYAPQWFALPKIVRMSETLYFRVLASTTEPPQIVCAQRQQYTLRYLGVKKVHTILRVFPSMAIIEGIIDSLLIIDLDEDHKIINLEDKWNGLDHPTHWGAETLRRLNAKTVAWFFRAKTKSS
ncbi:hypothetical protein BU17DRAFT_58363 [Hysterangium stoloniferum]|nr:hypothetical protein BU17DRAFT_58363 [Hysterangium stoloniferum]